MPRPKKLATVGSDVEVDYDRLEDIAFKGFRNLAHFAAELGLSLKALYDRRERDEAFRHQMDEAIARGHARKLGTALEMLWEKALEGDRAAIIKFVDRLDPELATTLAKQRRKPGFQIEDANVVVFTGEEMQRKLIENREHLRANRERLFVEEEADGPEGPEG